MKPEPRNLASPIDFARLTVAVPTAACPSEMPAADRPVKARRTKAISGCFILQFSSKSAGDRSCVGNCKHYIVLWLHSTANTIYNGSQPLSSIWGVLSSEILYRLVYL